MPEDRGCLRSLVVIGRHRSDVAKVVVIGQKPLPKVSGCERTVIFIGPAMPKDRGC